VNNLQDPNADPFQSPCNEQNDSVSLGESHLLAIVFNFYCLSRFCGCVMRKVSPGLLIITGRPTNTVHAKCWHA